MQMATNQTSITSGDADNYLPSWSPDGKRIAYTSRPSSGVLQIYVMNADGTGQTDLTNGATASDWGPAWSPDGTKIAFTSDRDGNREVYVMNADGSDPVNLTAPAPPRTGTPTGHLTAGQSRSSPTGTASLKSMS